MTENNLLPDQGEPKSYLEALTAPGGKFDKTKYATEAEMFEAIAKGKWHADSALSVKERAFDELSADYVQAREKLDSQATLQELLDQMSLNQQTPQHTQQRDEVRQPAMDPNQFRSLISEEVQSITKAQKESENLNAARAKLTERYGSNYGTEITKQLEDLGMSNAEFEQMAKSNPKLFERTFLPKLTPEGFQSPPGTTHRISTPEVKRTWNYYQQMKKDNPRLYSDPKTQMQLMKDYADLGKDFEDGDFHKF